MVKHGELANRIWRTVVFAGAMLVTPMGCGGSAKKAEPPAAPTPTEASMKQDEEAAAKAEADKQAAEQAALAAEKEKARQAALEAAAKEEADKKAAEELAAKEAADKKAAEEAAAKKKPRPRTTGKQRPTGRGFILS